MKLLSVLFSANKKKWFADMPDNQFEEERGIIIKNFMIEDNISYERYHANAKWQ